MEMTYGSLHSKGNSPPTPKTSEGPVCVWRAFWEQRPPREENKTQTRSPTTAEKHDMALSYTRSPTHGVSGSAPPPPSVPPRPHWRGCGPTKYDSTMGRYRVGRLLRRDTPTNVSGIHALRFNSARVGMGQQPTVSFLPGRQSQEAVLTRRLQRRRHAAQHHHQIPTPPRYRRKALSDGGGGGRLHPFPPLLHHRRCPTTAGSRYPLPCIHIAAAAAAARRRR